VGVALVGEQRLLEDLDEALEVPHAALEVRADEKPTAVGESQHAGHLSSSYQAAPDAGRDLVEQLPVCVRRVEAGEMWDSHRVSAAIAARRVRAVITGKVQGVSFRAATASEARRLGVTGWIRNLPDGRVELEVQGPADLVAALLGWCGHGPPAARVDGVATDPVDVVDGEAGFAVRSR
jgi:acylphosphatase